VKGVTVLRAGAARFAPRLGEGEIRRGSAGVADAAAAAIAAGAIVAFAERHDLVPQSDLLRQVPRFHEGAHGVIHAALQHVQGGGVVEAAVAHMRASAVADDRNQLPAPSLIVEVRPVLHSDHSKVFRQAEEVRDLPRRHRKTAALEVQPCRALCAAL
tara:strand:- start:91 stop:564 length:474 start_codon:yes stop_codon:yes gene_type:complete